MTEYVLPSNEELLKEVLLSKQDGKCSSKLALYFISIVEYAVIKKGFDNYFHREDMVGHALAIIMRTWNGFNPAKSSNVFGFFYMCAYGACLNYLNQEKRQREVVSDFNTYHDAMEK